MMIENKKMKSKEMIGEDTEVWEKMNKIKVIIKSVIKINSYCFYRKIKNLFSFHFVFGLTLVPFSVFVSYIHIIIYAPVYNLKKFT